MQKFVLLIKYTGLADQLPAISIEISRNLFGSRILTYLTRELDIVPDVDIYRRSQLGVRLVEYIV
jgi:hypothetical protein